MIRILLHKLDLFKANASLRTNGQPEHSNSCTAIFSFLLIVAFLALFIYMTVMIIDYKRIQANLVTDMSTSSQQILTNITIAIGLFNQNLTQMLQYFSVTSSLLDFNDSLVKEIELTPCTKDIITQISQQKFQQLKLSKYFCFKNSSQVYINGYLSSQNMVYLDVGVAPCDSSVSPVACQSLENIQKFMEDYAVNFGPMVSSIMVISTGFNPTYKQTTFQYFQDIAVYMVFSFAFSVDILYKLATYQIITDEGILPIEELNIQKGHYVDESSPGFYLRTPTQRFFSAYFFVSPRHLTINRKYGKIDDVLSYIGGLLGVLVSLFGIILFSFNQMRYQLRIASGAIKLKNLQNTRESKFGFIQYVKFSFYQFLNIFKKQKLQWEDCSDFQEASDEAIGLIEVQNLLKRISNLQNIVNKLTKNSQNLLTYLISNEDTQHVKYRRQTIEYIEKINNQGCITIEQLKRIDTDTYTEEEESSYKKKKRGGLTVYSKIESYLQENRDQCLQIFKAIEFTEEDLQIERKLAKMFWSLNEKEMGKIFQRISLPALYRFYEISNQKTYTQNFNEKLNSSQIQIQNKVLHVLPKF